MTKVHHGILGALALLASVLSDPAFAGYKPTAAQMSACRGDAFRLCAGQLTSRRRGCMPAVEEVRAQPGVSGDVPRRGGNQRRNSADIRLHHRARSALGIVLSSPNPDPDPGPGPPSASSAADPNPAGLSSPRG